MNAAEIYNIVKDWPKEAWPNRIACDGSAFLQLVYEGPDMSPVGGTEIHGDILELAFEASGMQWLLDRDEGIEGHGSPELHIKRGPWNGGMFRINYQHIEKYAPTRLAAIDAAIKGLST